MRIIPFTLRITHYSRAPASWPGRPKIHVAGYAPVDTLAGTTTGSEDRQRRLRGTVEMTASGDVRWTIVGPFIVIYWTKPTFFSVVFSRGRTGSMVHRRCTNWRTRLSHGGDWYVDQRRTRAIRPTRCVHHIPPILSYHSPSYHSFLFLFSKTKTHSPGFRSILGLESWAPE